ncbi:cupin domain-containing protein [Candidatus Dependentiae bacterium]
MITKKHSLQLLVSSMFFCSYVFAVTESSLFDAITAKKYLFPGEISPVSTGQNKNTWTFTAGKKTYVIVKGRPDKVCKAWKHFAAKINVGKEDLTVLTQSTEKAETKKTEFNSAQSKLLQAIKNADLKTIAALLKNKDTAKFRSNTCIHQLLNYAWNKNHRIKTATSFALGLLSQDKKLDPYIYRVWSEAADEKNYDYLIKGYDATLSPHCSSYITLLGIYNVAENIKKGFVIASCLPKATSRSVFRRTMDEDFFIISGKGEFWLADEKEEVGPFKVSAGDSLLNPKHMHIQFKNNTDHPLKMVVTTNPPFAEVVKKYPEDEKKEIHESIGYWKLEDRYKKVENEIKNIALEKNGKNKLQKILQNPDTPFLKRLYTIKLFPKKFIETKRNILKNQNENWALRKAIRKSTDL